MPHIPGHHEATEQAYSDVDEAITKHDPGKPKYTTTTTTTDAEGKDHKEVNPREINPNYGRSFPDGPVNNQQALDIMQGGAQGRQGPDTNMVGELGSDIADISNKETDAFNKYTAGVEAGAPPTPFGDPQREVLEKGIAPDATAQDVEAVGDIRGTRYTGDRAVDYQQDTSQIGTEAARAQSKAMVFSDAAPTTAERQRRYPEETPGEAKTTAAGMRGDPEVRQQIQDVQRTADVAVQKFQQNQQKAVTAEQEATKRAESYPEQADAYYAGRKGEIEADAQVRMDEQNRIRDVAQAAFDDYENPEHGDHKNLEKLIEKTPPGFLDQSVVNMLESPEYQKGEQMDEAYDEVHMQPEFKAIRDMPHMRKSAFYKQNTEHHMIDPTWLREIAPEHFPWMLESGTIDMYVNNPETHRRNGAHWDPSKDRTSYFVDTNADGIPDTLIPMVGAGGRRGRMTSEDWDEIIKFREWDRLARQRRTAFEEAGFGEGGEYEGYRSLGYMSGLFGEYQPSKMIKGTDIDWIMAGKDGQQILDAASISNVMDKPDKERVNNILKIMSLNQEAYDTNDVYKQEKVEAQLDAFLELNKEVLAQRVTGMGEAADQWRDILAQFHDNYRTTKRKRRQRAGWVIANIVLAIITMGTSLVITVPLLVATLTITISTSLIFAGMALSAALSDASVNPETGLPYEIVPFDQGEIDEWTYKGPDVTAHTGAGAPDDPQAVSFFDGE